RRSLSKIKSESILLGILYLIGLLCLCNDNDKKRGRPYVYPTGIMLRCFVVRIWMRIPSNNCLHHYFSINSFHNRKVMKACGLQTLPDRRTFDRRFKVLPVRDIIGMVGKRFVTEKIIDASTVSVDSSMMRAKNSHIWHRKQMASGIVPRPGIDTDARWGFSRSKGWLFGYKMHLSCSTGSLVVPLSAGMTSANVYDNQVYQELIGQLSDIRYVVADAGYDDQKLYDFSRYRGIRLVCPIRKYRRTKGERLEMISFYKSRKGQSIYRNRSVSIEPLFCIIKDTFGISVSPVIGFDNVSSYVLMCIFVYQIAVYYNCVLGKDNPRCIRRMLGN
ncbi:MAG: transposase, partial [Nitrosotalea sp.]